MLNARLLVSPTSNVNLTLFGIPSKQGKKIDIIELKCCNYCHLLSGISFTCQSSMRMFSNIEILGFIINVCWDDNTCILIHAKCCGEVATMTY